MNKRAFYRLYSKYFNGFVKRAFLGRGVTRGSGLHAMGSAYINNAIAKGGRSPKDIVNSMHNTLTMIDPWTQQRFNQDHLHSTWNNALNDAISVVAANNPEGVYGKMTADELVRSLLGSSGVNSMIAGRTAAQRRANWQAAMDRRYVGKFYNGRTVLPQYMNPRYISKSVSVTDGDLDSMDMAYNQLMAASKDIRRSAKSMRANEGIRQMMLSQIKNPVVRDYIQNTPILTSPEYARMLPPGAAGGFDPELHAIIASPTMTGVVPHEIMHIYDFTRPYGAYGINKPRFATIGNIKNTPETGYIRATPQSPYYIREGFTPTYNGQQLAPDQLLFDTEAIANTQPIEFIDNATRTLPKALRERLHNNLQIIQDNGNDSYAYALNVPERARINNPFEDIHRMSSTQAALDDMPGAINEAARLLDINTKQLAGIQPANQIPGTNVRTTFRDALELKALEEGWSKERLEHALTRLAINKARRRKGLDIY